MDLPAIAFVAIAAAFAVPGLYLVASACAPRSPLGAPDDLLPAARVIREGQSRFRDVQPDGGKSALARGASFLLGSLLIGCAAVVGAIA